MIFLDSRYNDSTITRAFDSRNGSYQLTVHRLWPLIRVPFFYYEWQETDRLEKLSLRYLGKPSLWWQIMDINPEIINPLGIKPGTQIRIPRA